MSTMREYFDDKKARDKERKKLNLQQNLEFLNSTNVEYEVYNHGNQLNLRFGRETVAFYPSTNKWVWRSKTHYGDAKALWDWIGKQEEETL